MSAKDSAGDKLIASIQKTKVQAATQGDKPASVSAKPATKKSVAKKAVVKKAAAKKPATAKKATSANRSSKESLVKTFQHGRRVWPD